MKSRWNLAADPFLPLNRRLVIMVCLLVLTLALLVYNIQLTAVSAVGLRYNGKALSAAKSREKSAEKKASELKNKMTGPITQAKIRRMIALNDILREKRFSWLRLLADLEEVKPYGLELHHIRPNFSAVADKDLHMSLEGQVRKRKDLLEFEANLLASPRFGWMVLSKESQDEKSPLVSFSMEVRYHPENRP